MSRSPDPQCVVCGDARGTTHMCSHCKADPTNANWKDGREVALFSASYIPNEPVEWNEVPVWNPTDLQRAVLQALILGELSIRQTSKYVGCTVAQVRTVTNAFRLNKKRIRTLRLRFNGEIPAHMFTQLPLGGTR